MGFEYAELSHGTRIVLVPGILRAVEEGVIKISSTHNFCPLPTGINHSAPNLFEPSAQAEKEHDQWLRHTLRSIDFTAQVGASAMVTHLGSVHFFWSNPSRKVKAYRRAHPEIDPATDAGYRRVLSKAYGKLRARMSPLICRRSISAKSTLYRISRAECRPPNSCFTVWLIRR